ncbi:hypothetical protein K438DRAFT_1779360 [Mycena galopus ATCC 62051]|nr:hypothetical protein K438DRAFT_1779360 [Mycena galopus ATCC 62051]
MWRLKPEEWEASGLTAIRYKTQRLRGGWTPKNGFWPGLELVWFHQTLSCGRQPQPKLHVFVAWKATEGASFESHSAFAHNQSIRAHPYILNILSYADGYNVLNAQAGKYAPTAARIRVCGPPRPTYQGQEYGYAAGLDVSIHNPNAGLSNYDPFAANASLRASSAKEAGTPMCVDPHEVMAGGAHIQSTTVPLVDGNSGDNNEPDTAAQMVNELRKFMPETGASVFAPSQ